MTMHLVRGMTSLNTRKRKSPKLTAGKLERLQQQHKEHNKQMKRLGMHDHMMNINEYIDYIHGRYKSKKKTETVMNTPWHYSGPYVRETQHIPSLTTEKSFQPATKKEPLQYTGERRLVGIATMHKSNMVPIFADDDDVAGRKAATEITLMKGNK